MRDGRIFSKWVSWLQAIKAKWTRTRSNLLSALAEEETKMRREEILRQIRASRE